MSHQRENGDKKPFLAHLEELRRRLIVCLSGIGFSFIITYSFKERIFEFLMKPYLKVMPDQSGFIFTYITEAFVTYLKVAFVAAIFLASPLILYEIWMFVAPGLYEHEKRYVYPFIFFGSILFVSGALFSYFVVIPYVYRFFVSFAQEFVVPMPDLKGYMGLTLKMLILFGFVFELPLVMYYLGKAGVISSETLKRKRKFAILGIFIVSAFLTPPDVTSQILLAFPLIGLYEISILILKVFGKKR
ncbi:MAG: twin-arginine translocase subunit TatC [Desulfobacterota bacterium]|nr:twin-arginine translocase subunit TatC [Thermodesulfobacteriota bacterium]MDW8002069.1 twin-arginine translocase subunit TatC [Deltaproteobacteria bacterium]